jgi:signal transduction histidine kinase
MIMSTGASAGPASLRQLLDAVLAIGSDLDLAATLERIVRAATTLVDARYGALGVLSPEGTTLTDFITVGIDADERAQIGGPPKGHGILGLLIVDPRPLRLANLTEHPDSFGLPPNHPPMRSFLGVPVIVRGKVFGNLYLADKQSGDAFTEIDEELTVALATGAGVAIENARLHGRVRDLALLEDRERIAMDLHDTVIQELFATGLQLQATARLTGDIEVAIRIEQAVEDLDATIRQIRSSIFALSMATRSPVAKLRAHLAGLVAETAPSLGFEARLDLSGPVDSAVDPVLGDELLSALREALANIARHAQATTATVHVTVAGDELVLRVTDDGVGPPAGLVVGHAPTDDDGDGGGHGLANLARRAERRGGSFALGAHVPRGAELTWRVPLTS